MIEYYKQLAEVVEWQTRRTQNPLMATSCGFKSRLRHQYNKNRTEYGFLLYIANVKGLEPLRGPHKAVRFMGKASGRL